MKRQIMGREVVVAITNGQLDFGPWEQIFYGEFDGRRAEAGAGEGDRRVSGRGRDSAVDDSEPQASGTFGSPGCPGTGSPCSGVSAPGTADRRSPAP